jgi:hypothetical protein
MKFHGQKRGARLVPDFLETADKVGELCGSMCKEKVGGMDMLEAEAWRKGVADPVGVGGKGFRWSHMASPTYIDDMCDDCA